MLASARSPRSEVSTRDGQTVVPHRLSALRFAALRIAVRRQANRQLTAPACRLETAWTVQKGLWWGWLGANLHCTVQQLPELLLGEVVDVQIVIRVARVVLCTHLDGRHAPAGSACRLMERQVPVTPE